MGCTPPKKTSKPELREPRGPREENSKQPQTNSQDEFKANEEINPITSNKINSVAAYPSLQQPSRIQKEQANITIYQPLIPPIQTGNPPHQTGNLPSAKLIFEQNDQKRKISNQDFQKKELFIDTVPQNRIPFEQPKQIYYVKNSKSEKIFLIIKQMQKMELQSIFLFLLLIIPPIQIITLPQHGIIMVPKFRALYRENDLQSYPCALQKNHSYHHILNKLNFNMILPLQINQPFKDMSWQESMAFGRSQKDIEV